MSIRFFLAMAALFGACFYCYANADTLPNAVGTWTGSYVTGDPEKKIDATVIVSPSGQFTLELPASTEGDDAVKAIGQLDATGNFILLQKVDRTGSLCHFDGLAAYYNHDGKKLVVNGEKKCFNKKDSDFSISLSQ